MIFLHGVHTCPRLVLDQETCVLMLDLVVDNADLILADRTGISVKQDSLMVEGNNVVRLPSETRIEAEAAAWIARLDKDEVCAGDQAAFMAWCKFSDMHLSAVNKLAALWTDMDALGRAFPAKTDLTAPVDNGQVQDLSRN